MSPTHSRERTLCVGVFLVCLALHLGFSCVGWHNNLLEGHEFRQAQTALAARSLQSDGWSLAYPLPLFGPPWSAPMEFPIYEYLTAGVGRLSGGEVEPSGRFVSLVFFYVSLPAFFMLLGGFELPSHRRWLFLAAILMSPVYLYYSRTVMIESTALCAAAWFLLAYVRTIDSGKRRWLVAAILLGVVAALAKITTLIVFLAVAAIYSAHRLRGLFATPKALRAGVALFVTRALLATIPAVVVGSAWVRYSDGIKGSNPLSVFLTSGPMTAFNFGTLGQRFSLVFWQQIFRHISVSVLPEFALAVLVIFGVMWAHGRRGGIALLLAGFFCGPLIFANLYFVHDYYIYTTGVFLLAALALAWSRLLDVEGISQLGKWLVIVLCLSCEAYGFTQTYFRLQGPRPAPPALAHALTAITAPADVVVIYGFEWNPILPYYAHRRAIMVSNLYAKDRSAISAVLQRLSPGSVGALVVAGEFRRDTETISFLTRTLALTERPVLASSDVEVHLAQRLLPTAGSVLDTIEVPGFTSTVPNESMVPGIKWERYNVARLPDQSLFDMMSPHPVQVRAPFGISNGTVDGKRVFTAHAPTEVVFALASEVTSVTAAFGVAPEAYENGHSLDGVKFLVELVRTDGTRTTLFEKFLDPSRRPDDRGTHRVNFKLLDASSGRLIFSALPGPANNISFNWAYWAEVAIK